MNEKINMSVILSELRTKKGVTQEEAAANLGVSNKTISKWETGFSLPETEYLTEIADYYDVSVNELFGREVSNRNINDLIFEQYNDLSKSEAVIKSFQMTHDVILGCMNQFNVNWENRNEPDFPDPKLVFNYSEYFNRSLISTPEVFELLLNNKYANMAVMLASGEDDFGWLIQDADEYLPLLKFLSDVNAMKIFRLMHSQQFPNEFTADFIAKAIEIDENIVIDLLDQSAKFNICDVEEMFLKDGVTKLYKTRGNGYILSALTLIHEWICGKNNHHNAYHGLFKPIQGGTQS